jgi:hypothetical protein
MDLNNSYLFDDSPSTVNNCPSFKESRHDQQMLDLILHKYFSNIDFPISDGYGYISHQDINGLNRHE